MKHADNIKHKPGTVKPLVTLKDLVKAKNVKLCEDIERLSMKAGRCESPEPYKDEPPCKYGLEVPPPLPDQDLNDTDLFLSAVNGCTPLYGNKKVSKKNSSKASAVLEDLHETDLQDREVYLKLKRLVADGVGYVVADTAEYIEGLGYNVNKKVAEKLHRGDFSIQAHIDLHGHSVESAESAFDTFMREAVLTGKRAVLIVHGRGLSSPDKPVLKTKLLEWLTKGPWRKWVMAYTAAGRCDGGAGATYILLRKRPITKKDKKNR